MYVCLHVVIAYKIKVPTIGTISVYYILTNIGTISFNLILPNVGTIS